MKVDGGPDARRRVFRRKHSCTRAVWAAYLYLRPAGWPNPELPITYLAVFITINVVIDSLWCVNTSLYWLVQKTETRALGGLGFLLMAIGFALQIAGTLAAGAGK
jgi:hypothetical protein